MEKQILNINKTIIVSQVYKNTAAKLSFTCVNEYCFIETIIVHDYLNVLMSINYVPVIAITRISVYLQALICVSYCLRWKEQWDIWGARGSFASE